MALIAMLGFASCKPQNVEEQKKDETKFITEQSIKSALDSIKAIGKVLDNELLERGVMQVAHFWVEKDGSQEEFINFCKLNYKSDTASKKSLFLKLSRGLEVMNGNSLKMMLELREPTDMDGPEVDDIDLAFSAFDPSAHLTEDLFANKLAFTTILNFPNFKLEEKQKLGEKWTRLEWAYARIGDVFTARVPAEILQNMAEATANADAYISEYNIFMGQVLGKDGKTHFPVDMKLISHWNLRDELKSNYTLEGGLDKQEMIYSVMKHIVMQDIPQDVINNGNVQWDVFSNKVLSNGKEIAFKPENNTRYEHLLKIFKSISESDKFYSDYPNYIDRSFSKGMEITQADVEKLFVELVSSPQVKQVAELIKKNLGRELRPYDIWYNGFKAQSSLTEEQINAITQKKYPNALAVEKDLPNILIKLQFEKPKASEIASKIRVDASRGAGHAWGAEMHSEKARLRTRIGENGMNYKGYNIMVHEFGHNVEQTITLHDVDYYMMRGVPNTAFTEALAFIFQKRDLALLGLEEKNAEKEHLEALSNFWACYEIMGVSLVDMKVWKWLYSHPDATPEQLKNAVIGISKEVWNLYFAPVFGSKDEPILAIYSHMIESPLYLSAYPIGHLIDFQIEKQIAGKNFANEIQRIYPQGRLVPQLWMKKAVGTELSIAPLLEATTKAIEVVGKK